MGLVKEGRQSGGAAEAWPSDLSSLHGGTDLLLTVVFSLPFLRNFIFSEELNLQRTHPSGVDTQAPILFSSLAFNYKKNQKSNSGIVTRKGKGKRYEGKEITSSSITG